LKIYRSRHCNFSVPDDWVQEDAFNFHEDSPREGRMHAGMVERWLGKPQAPGEIVARYLEIFPHLFREFELLEGPREEDGAVGLRYRWRDADDVPLFQTTIVRSSGPLLCELTLSRLAEEDLARELLLKEIGATFRLHPLPHLDRCTSTKVVALPEERSTDRRNNSFPHLCISLDVPEGWQPGEVGNSVILDGGRSRISIRRSLLTGGDPDVWLSSRLHGFQERGDMLLAQEKGETLAGDVFAALLYDLNSGHSSWKTESASRKLEVFLDGPQPLIWSLEGNAYQVETTKPLLEELLREHSFLPPSEWELRPEEAWIGCRLYGPWTAPDASVYLLADGEDFSLIHLDLQELPAPINLRNNAERITGPLDAGFESIHRKRYGIVDFQDFPSLNYLCDGTNSEDRAVSVRAVWIETPTQLYSVFVQCTDRSEATRIFAMIRDSIRMS